MAKVKRGKLIVFSGPSGVGKHTILQQILNKEDLNLAYSVSMTTRPMRDGEVNGVDYYFVSHNQFDQAIKNGDLIEWAEFVHNKYGTPKKEVDRLRNLGKHVILEIEVVGALQVLEEFKDDDLLSIFLLPPSLEELRNRLNKRNTETKEIIEKRIIKAEKEIGVKDKYMYNIINDTPERAAAELEEIIRYEVNK
ncbi:guanylate kinase [Ureaplasma canigenitalium]|uniref:guanylate kinase n=1 Tax=Ureaplasma canigenitalium TaxID=42092 RepID=UPI0004E1EE7A|nr:guanylate kinase [Ureaplasma canigenitalium]